MKWLVLVAVAACAGAPRPKYDTKHGVIESASAGLLDAIARKDLQKIQHYLGEPIELRGLWFPDPACQQQFSSATKVASDALPAFAKCLATLPLHPSNRIDPMFGVAVATYDPGIEIELVFTYWREDPEPHLRSIGFTGHRDLGDAVPTVTPAALESLRVAGEVSPTLAPEADQALRTQLTQLGLLETFAWFKVCVGADGKVASVHARESASPLLATTYAKVIEQWQFQPFKLGDQPSAVCTHERVVYPNASSAPEILPWPNPSATDAPLLHVPSKLLQNAAPNKLTHDFSQRDQQMVDYSDTIIVEATVGVCMTEQGAVTDTYLLETSGLPDYDASIQREMHDWRFKPIVIGGAPARVCSVIKIHNRSEGQYWFENPTKAQSR